MMKYMFGNTNISVNLLAPKVVITVLGVSPTHPLLSRNSKYVSHDKTGVILGIAESLPTYAILIAHGLSLQSLNWRVIRVDPIQVLQ